MKRVTSQKIKQTDEVPSEHLIWPVTFVLFDITWRILIIFPRILNVTLKSNLKLSRLLLSIDCFPEWNCLFFLLQSLKFKQNFFLLLNSKEQQNSARSPFAVSKYTILQNKRMRRCGVAPPPIIFERLKLPQQIIYRRKGSLSESPNHQKYWENILVSRFYEQF